MQCHFYHLYTSGQFRPIHLACKYTRLSWSRKLRYPERTQAVTLLISKQIFLQKVDKIPNAVRQKPHVDTSYREAADSDQVESNKGTKQTRWLA